jgi:hypothetical protein
MTEFTWNVVVWVASPKGAERWVLLDDRIPFTRSGKTPPGVLAVLARVRVEWTVPLEGRKTEAGEKLYVTPAGMVPPWSAATVRLMVPVWLLTGVTATSYVTLP